MAELPDSNPAKAWIEAYNARWREEQAAAGNGPQPRAPARAGHNSASARSSTRSADELEAWAQTILDDEIAAVRVDQVGERNHQLNCRALRCFRVAMAAEFDLDDVEAALLAAAQVAGNVAGYPHTDREIIATLRSARAAAKREGPAYPNDPEATMAEKFTRTRKAAGNAADNGQTDSDTAVSWEPVDLGPWLSGTAEPPQPTVGVARSDGLQLLYPGCEHAVLGDTESGKTWFAILCVIAEITSDHHVVYVHYEEPDPASTIERLRLLGVDTATIKARLYFVAPQEPPTAEKVDALAARNPTLVIHDGINEGMSLIGAKIDAEGWSLFRRRLITPFRRCGATALACDHFPMGRDADRLNAFGTVHKGNALDGARYVLENIKPFGRKMRGVSNLYITKDRPGTLRAHGKPSKTLGKFRIGTLVVDDMVEGPNFLAKIWAPRDKDQPEDVADAVDTFTEQVYDTVAKLPGQTVESERKLFAAVRGAGLVFTNERAREAAEDLVFAKRFVEVRNKNRKGYRAV